MTPHDSFQIRLNLIDGVAAYIRETCGEGAPEDGPNPMRQLLDIYRADTVRRSKGEQGSLDFLWDQLKTGVRLAGAMMQEIQDSPCDGELLRGWYTGCKPANMMQALYSVLYETSIELTKSIQEIEGQHPEMQRLFDAEREAYRMQCSEELEQNKFDMHWTP